MLASAVLLIAVLLIAVAAVAWRIDLVGVRSSTPLTSVAMAFDPPPPYPGYSWSRNGQPVSGFELTTAAGPDHCGWQSATFLSIGWPPGTVSTSAVQSRQYIRDPKGEVSDDLRARLRLNVILPPDARPTGHERGPMRLYVSGSDQDEAIYVVAPGGAERWPRSDPMTGCA